MAARAGPARLVRAGDPLSSDDLVAERFRGISPAFGYPACPDHTEKRTLFELLGAESCGARADESFAMLPAAAVSGVFFRHPASRYFSVGRVGRTSSRTTPGARAERLKKQSAGSARTWRQPDAPRPPEAAALTASTGD